MQGSILCLAFAGILVPSQSPTREIGVDAQPVWDELALDDPALVEGHPTVGLSLKALADGKVTISAGSYDFDVLLRIENEAGDNLNEDDDSGVETNARLVVPLRAKQVYRILVAGKSGRPGSFWVQCRIGDQPAFTREAELDAAVLFYGASAGEAQAQDRLAVAASHLEKKGSFLRQLTSFEKAEEAWSSARDLWAQVGEKQREAGATLELGRLAAAMGKPDEAEARFAQALAAYRAIPSGPDGAGEARSLLAIAEARVTAGDLASGAARFAESIVAAKGSGDTECQALALAGLAAAHHASGDRRSEREATERLGDLWRDQRDFEKARASHQQALEIAREIADPSAEGRAWSDLGLDWHKAREDTHARECFEEALRIARESGDTVAQAEALGGLGKIAFAKKDYRAALRFHEEQAEAAGQDPIQSCEAALRMGRCLKALDDDARARTCLESVLVKARAAGRKLDEAEALDLLSLIEQQAGHPDLASAHRERSMQLRAGSNEKLQMAFEKAEHLFHGGQLRPAQAAFEECLEIEKSNRDPWGRMVTLLRLADCLEKHGRFAEAIRRSSEALELARTLGIRLDEIEALERLGVESGRVGALDASLQHLEDALSIAREMGDFAQELDILNAIGNVHLELHQTEKACESYEQVAILGGKLGMPIAEAVSLNNIGVAYWGAGRYAESRPFLEQAVQAAAELRSAGKLAEFRGNLARTLSQLGERDQAEELATRSLQDMDAAYASGSGDPRMLLIPLDALTGIALEDGDVESARRLLERAAGVLEGLRLEAQASPEELGVNPWLPSLRWDRHGQDFVRLLDLEGGDDPAERAKILAEGFRQADRARARQLSSGIIEHRRGARSKDALEYHGRWKQALAAWQMAQKSVSAAIRDERSAEEVDRLQQEVVTRRKEAERLGLVLSQNSPRDAALDVPRGADPADVRKAAIRKSVALVEYAEGDEGLYAYVLTEASLVLIDLGRRAAIDAGIQSYLELLTPTEPPAGAAEIGKAGHELFRLLLEAPLAAAGEGIDRLLIVPTPSLSVLPFDALVVSPRPDARGFGDLEFVIDRREVSYCPSASILVQISAVGARKSIGKMLVLADPVYPSESAAIEASAPGPESAAPSVLMGRRRGPDGQAFERLPKTREEALVIAGELVESSETEALARLSQLQKTRGGSLHAKNLDLHLGADATAAALAGDLRPYQVLHLAAHGWVDGQLPRKTGIALSWTGPGDYQGLFTIADVSGLDLDTDLVVLSACDTARGAVLAGEGVESMACAFLLAGSRSVVASLWQVSDQAAAQTMQAFYAGIWNEGKSWSGSLRDAKLAIRRGSASRGLSIGKPANVNEGHPSAWAPFIYIGAPR